MSDLKLTIDKELTKEFRDFQIDSILDQNNDDTFKCYVLNRVFEKYPERKESILEKAKEFDWVEIDVMTGQILQYDNHNHREYSHMKIKKLGL